jgi:hypothetical protein
MRKKFVINFITLLLVVIIGLAVIWPEFSKILVSRKNLDAMEEKLTALIQKSQKIEQLNQELSQNPKNQETVLKYIPTTRSEDFLINYLDGIAYTEGIGIRDVVLADKDVNNLLSQSMVDGSQVLAEGALPAQISPRPIFLTAKLKFFSDYEKVGALLKKIDGLKRSNESTYLKITKTYPADNDKDASLDFLQVELGLDFNYMKKIASQAEIGAEIFEKESFDNEIIKNIEAKAINNVNGPENGSDGRNNPFIP